MASQSNPNPLRESLDEQDIKIPAFAERLDISRQHMWRLITGKRVADTPMLARMADAANDPDLPNKWVQWWRKEQSKPKPRKRRSA